QAHNRYLAAWKQLAAAMGVPGMPLTELAGRADAAIPLYQYEKLLAYVLANHTDVLTALAGEEKGRQLLRLAQLTPVPDLSVFVSVVDDQSPPGPPRAVASLQVGVPVPFFDRNQGAIYQAQSNLVRASEEPHRVRADLTGRLAEAFERYQSNRALVAMYARE